MVLTSIGLGSDNGKRFKVSAVGLLPVVPQTSEGERHCCWVGKSDIEDAFHRFEALVGLTGPPKRSPVAFGSPIGSGVKVGDMACPGLGHS